MLRTRLATLLATAVLAAVVSAGSPARADIPDPTTPPPAPEPAKPTPDKPTPDTPSPDKPKAVHKTGQAWLDGYWAAHALIQNGDYEAGIAALRALGTDNHADVANYIGYASRKLGRYDDARRWYEAALAADPDHTRTWQYYGLWHLEQGNRLKAEDHLARIKSICGTECRDYVSLKQALAGRMVY